MVNNIYQMDIEDYISILEEAIELGKERGKVKGDDLSTEFFEIAQLKEMIHKIQYLGQTDKDIDLLTGDLRENGLKVINLKEEERKHKNDL